MILTFPSEPLPARLAVAIRAVTSPKKIDLIRIYDFLQRLNVNKGDF